MTRGRRSPGRLSAGFFPTSAANKLHVSRVHFQRVARFSITVGPFFYSQASFDINRPPALQILRGSFCLTTPQSHSKPGGDVVVFSGISVLASLVSRHAEAANRCALGRVTQLGVAAEITNQSNFVERH